VFTTFNAHIHGNRVSEVVGFQESISPRQRVLTIRSLSMDYFVSAIIPDLCGVYLAVA
jgi:hypothetical protein